jgi:hypothetical protein
MKEEGRRKKEEGRRKKEVYICGFRQGTFVREASPTMPPQFKTSDPKNSRGINKNSENKKMQNLDTLETNVSGVNKYFRQAPPNPTILGNFEFSSRTELEQGA